MINPPYTKFDHSSNSSNVTRTATDGGSTGRNGPIYGPPSPILTVSSRSPKSVAALPSLTCPATWCTRTG